MIDNKIFAGGGLNFDDDYHIMPKTDWVDAKNIRVNTTSGGYKGAVVNLRGTESIYELTDPDGTYLAVGAKGFDNVGKIFIFFALVEGLNPDSKIVVYDKATGTATVLVDRNNSGDTDVLNFGINRRINHIDLVDEKYLYWVESAGDSPVNPPRVLDITKNYGTITERSLSVIKQPPLKPILNLNAIDDPSGFYNNIGTKTWQFKYRYIYWDNSKSSYSPVSGVGNQRSRGNAAIQTFAPKIFDSSLQFNFNGGGSLVKGVEIIGRGMATEDWRLVTSFDFDNQTYLPIYRLGMSDFSISYSVTFTVNGTPTTITGTGSSALLAMNDLSFKFDSNPISDLISKKYISNSGGLGYMEFTPKLNTTTLSMSTSTSNVVNLIQVQNQVINTNDNCLFTFSDSRNLGLVDQTEAVSPFDYVPLYANAQCAPNGNYIAYGDYTEGYDNVNLDMQIEPYVSIIEKPSYSVAMSNPLTPSPNQRVVFTFSGTFTNDVVLVYQKLLGAGEAKYINSFPALDNETESDFLNRFGAALQALEGKTGTNPRTVSVDVGARTVTLTYTVSYPTQFYESVILSRTSRSWFKGGSSNKFGIVYIDDYGRFGAVNTSATNSFSVPVVNNFNFEFDSSQPYLKIKSLAPSWASKYAIVATKSNNIGKFVQFGIAAPFTFNNDNTITIPKKGIDEYNTDFNCSVDYIFVKGDEVVFFAGDGTSFTTSLKEINDDGDFIINANGLTNETFVGYQINRVEIRQKTSASDGLYYQIGLIGDISEEGYHLVPDGALGSDQTNLSPASIVVSNGDIIARNVWLEPNATSLRESEWLEHYSFSDYDSTVVNWNIGTPNQVNSFEKQTRYQASVRFGGAYVVGSSINNISSFDVNSIKDFSLNYGPIQRLDIDGNRMVVGQRLRVGMAPVFEAMFLDKADNETVAISEKLINDITYYAYEAGIGDAPESYVRWGSSKYFVDKLRGVVCRINSNGITPISITAKANSYFTSQLKMAETVVVGFDPRHQELYITIVNGENNKTIAFSEDSNRFSCFWDGLPSSYVMLYQDLYAFDGNALWKLNETNTYNNIFGEQSNSYIQFVANDSPLIKKTFLALSEVASDLWLPTMIETDLGQESELFVGSFKELEGEFHAALLKDGRSRPGVTNPLYNGPALKGKWLKCKLENNSTNFVYLLSSGIKYIVSPQTGI